MEKVIVYQIAGSPVSIMYPVIPQYIAPGVMAPEQLDIVQIGEKDVPPGIPFWVVDVSSVPTDRTYRNAWELDPESLGQPDGFGSIKEQ